MHYHLTSSSQSAATREVWAALLMAACCPQVMAQGVRLLAPYICVCWRANRARDCSNTVYKFKQGLIDVRMTSCSCPSQRRASQAIPAIPLLTHID
jgi:hypothetical protein